ncbi:MAG: hypothetical protein AAGA48_25950 [Myxococcota bacterium]
MNRTLIPLALMVIGCEPAPEPFSSDVFWIDLVSTDTICPDVEISTSITNANPIGVDGTFDRTITQEATLGGDYAYVTKTEDGTILVNYRDAVLRGTENNGAIEVSWAQSERLDETREGDTYIHTRVEEQAVEETLILRPAGGEDSQSFSGSYSRRDLFLLEVAENDEWDADVVGTGATQMPETDDWLVWEVQPSPQQDNVINQEFFDDCPDGNGDLCSLRVNSDCTREFAVTAIRIEGADVDTFEALVDFNQDEGVP